MKKYVIEAIQREAPYFSFGYVKSFDGNEVKWTSNHNEAMQAPLEDLEAAARFIDKHYDGKQYVRLMSWFYEIDENGKQAKEKTFFKDFK